VLSGAECWEWFCLFLSHVLLPGSFTPPCSDESRKQPRKKKKTRSNLKALEGRFLGQKMDGFVFTLVGGKEKSYLTFCGGAKKPEGTRKGEKTSRAARQTHSKFSHNKQSRDSR
jgi:hypothetical protein